MVTCKQEALRWVHLYAAGGAIFAAAPLPVSTAPLLATLETHMISVISDIYGAPFSGVTTAAAGGTFTVLGTGLKAAVGRAVRALPVIGPVIRAGTAAATIEAIGYGIVQHFERKFPNKPFSEKSSV
ncbi:MAG: hypothetical protein HOW73_06515 [Polyangiaceae bacterium]|nr:hypothetical protein [Polyangiaceae bacterium]